MAFDLVLHVIVSLLTRTSATFLDVLIVWLELFILTVPIGFFALKITDARSQISFGLAAGVGTLFLLLSSYFFVLLHLPQQVLIALILIMDLFLAVHFYKNSTRYNHFFFEKNLLKKIFFGVIMTYYLFIALTVDYGFDRDYDAFALGIKTTGDFVLPVYHINNFYSPFIGTFGAFLSVLNPFININRLFVISFCFFMIILFAMTYNLGRIFFHNKNYTLICPTMLAMIASTRNAVIGGSTYPAILGTIFSIGCLLFTFSYLRNPRKKDLILAGLFLGGITLSHADILLSFLWSWIALFIAHVIMSRNRRTVIFAFTIISLIGISIASPYLLQSVQNEKIMKILWTDKVWCDKIRGESSPKPVTDILFFTGRIIYLFVAAGILSSIYSLLPTKKDSFALWLILWWIFIIGQNSLPFLIITKPFLHIYPLNIIMWTGLTVPLLVTSSYGVHTLFARLKKNTVVILQIILLVVAIGLIIDFETFNKENVYGQSALKEALSSRMVVTTLSDIHALEWLKQNSNGTMIMNPDNYVGYLAPIITESQTMNIFYEESYHDPRNWTFMQTIKNESRTFYAQPASATSKKMLHDKNITYIFLPASMDTTPSLAHENPRIFYNRTIIESGNYVVVFRENGVKILKQDDTAPAIQHIEIEDFAQKKMIRTYTYGISIHTQTAALLPSDEITIHPTITWKTDYSIIHVKYLSFIESLPIKIHIGNESITLQKTSNKLQFIEDSFVIKTNLLKNPLHITTPQPPLHFFGKEITPEIDWIEIEERPTAEDNASFTRQSKS